MLKRPYIELIMPSEPQKTRPPYIQAFFDVLGQFWCFCVFFVFLAFLFKKQFCVDQKTLFGGVFINFEYLFNCRKKAVFEPFCEELF
jgi:hypothetical protein